MPLLEINGLVSGYGPLNVLHGVSLVVRRGEAVAVLGPNGAGKSTLMQTIVGLLPPREGTITFDRRDVTSARPESLLERGIALVPEGRRVFAALTVEENLMVGAYGVARRVGRTARRERLERACELFPLLAERLREKAGNLSGGEQQMLAISRALMSEPRVLLLDEASLGLAPRMVQLIFETVARLAEGGTAVLLADQNGRMALEVSSRAYVMTSGAIVRSGGADELRRNGDLAQLYLGADPNA